MSRAAFRKADRAHRNHVSVSQGQRKELQRLALKAGIEMPRVYNQRQARDAITRLKKLTSQPVLEGFPLECVKRVGVRG